MCMKTNTTHKPEMIAGRKIARKARAEIHRAPESFYGCMDMSLTRFKDDRYLLTCSVGAMSTSVHLDGEGFAKLREIVNSEPEER